MKIPERAGFWAALAAVTGLAGLSVGTIAGWKASVVESAEWHQRVQSHLEQTAPAMEAFQQNLMLDAVQEARIAALETSTNRLINKMDELLNRLPVEKYGPHR